MIGKVVITSSGYDPDLPRDHPNNIDPTLSGGAEKLAEAVGLSPVGRRVLVSVEDMETFRNVALPRDVLAKELKLCIVLAVGPKAAATHPKLVPGVPIWLKPFCGTEVIVHGRTLLFIRPDDVVGVAEPGEL